MTRPIPLLGDISLEVVQRIEHRLDAGFVPTPIAGLQGEVQQRSGRPSHQIAITGILMGEAAADQLSKLQKAAADGEELNFAADITTALELQRVVITSFRAVEMAAHPNHYRYQVVLAESPPLPPPAEVSGFGGLDDFGLGDLGFDGLDNLLGDLEDLAGDIASAVNDALDVIDQLSALANIGDLGGLGGVFDPLNAPVSKVVDIADNLTNAIGSLGEAFTS
jgi:hypothetical protein